MGGHGRGLYRVERQENQILLKQARLILGRSVDTATSNTILSSFVSCETVGQALGARKSRETPFGAQVGEDEDLGKTEILHT